MVPTPSAVPDRPLLDAGAAAARGRQALGQDATVLTSELVIYAPTDRPPRLAWRLELETAADARWSVVVDARSGQVLQSYNQIPTAAVQGAGLDLFGATQPLNLWAASGLYWMVDTSKPMFDPTSKPPNQGRGVIQILDARNQPATNDPAGQPPPNLFSVTSSQPDAGWLSSAVSAATNLSTTYDFYLKVLGRNSVDGQGGTLRGVVRLAKGYDNAFWATNMGTLFFGDAEPFAGALDVVAHELTHGVTDYTARLIYFAQSGALSEAFSDIFGELAEAYASGTNDWIMGTRLNRPIRNLKDPGALRTELGPPFPAKMSQYLQTTEDNAGVHYNSTIISHAFYLLAEGLPGAIGRDDAGRIFYRALSLHLTPEPNSSMPGWPAYRPPRNCSVPVPGRWQPPPRPSMRWRFSTNRSPRLTCPRWLSTVRTPPCSCISTACSRPIFSAAAKPPSAMRRAAACSAAARSPSASARR